MTRSINYTFFAFQINSLLDNDQKLSHGDTYDHINDGTLFVWLKELYGSQIDLSLYKEEDFSEMIAFFQGLANVVDARRKMGVKNNGLSLLLAYCIEYLQQNR